MSDNNPQLLDSIEHEHSRFLLLIAQLETVVKEAFEIRSELGELKVELSQLKAKHIQIQKYINERRF
jgi:hypothetical protein